MTLSPENAAAALTILEYVADLFTISGRESFSRDEILIILSRVKNDPELFDPEDVVTFDQVLSEESAE